MNPSWFTQRGDNAISRPIDSPCMKVPETRLVRGIGMTGRTIYFVVALLVGLLVGVLFPRLAKAETGITNIIDGVNTNAGATFTIGDTGPFNALIITNGGSVSNGVGIVGNAAGASNNLAVVTGSGSVWTNVGAFTLGNSGSGNQLIITDGGLVVGTTVTIGDQTSGRFNTALVTGSGSVWTNTGSMLIGAPGHGNQLIITNGAQVYVDAATLGSGGAASNNIFLIYGAGSLLMISGALNLGTSGADFGQMVIADGAQVINANSGIGSSGDSNTVLVTGSGSVWTNTGAMRVGDDGSYNTLVISNGAAVHSQSPGSVSVNSIGHDSGSHNVVIVTDPGSLWNVPGGINGSIRVGHGATSHDNSLIISNGGFVSNVRGVIGSSASSNYVIVTGSGSTWSNQSGLVIGDFGSSNHLLIADGGVVRSATGILGVNPSASNNLVTVTGAGSQWALSSSLEVGDGGAYNTLVISNGALVSNSSGMLGSTATAPSNTVVVTGPGSTWSNTSTLTIGNRSVGNQLIISNGATVFGGASLLVGALTNNLGEASQGSVFVTGPGSLLQIGGSVNVGSNTAQLAGSRGSGSLWITDGATLDASTLRAGANNSGWITNDGGVYQFDDATPAIVTNSGGNIVLKDGTISFRDVTTANVYGNAIGSGSNQLVNITYLGQNAFRLNAASNTTSVAQNYVFDTGLGATNYSRLELVNNGSLWRSAHLTVGNGGELLASNATARVAATVTNIGSIKVVDSTLTFVSNVVVQGSYVSDASTNIVEGNVHLLASGSLAGEVGDVYDFRRDLLIESTNQLDFDLSLSTVRFSGGVNHTNAITGSDRGTNGLPIAGNFGYGTLQLGAAGDHIFFTNLTGTASNALYIWNLDLFGDSNFVANLHAPTSVNIYYAASTENPFNSYLFDQTYVLNGGGLLLAAIPEPSAVGLIFLGALAGLCRRRRSGIH